jgi:hypothetical protein
MTDHTQMAEDVKRNLSVALVDLEELMGSHESLERRELAKRANDDVFNALSLIHYGKQADDLGLKEIEELCTLVENWADIQDDEPRPV